MQETLRDPCRNSCRHVFKNIPDDTSEESYETPSKKGEFDHVCLKALKEDDMG